MHAQIPSSKSAVARKQFSQASHRPHKEPLEVVCSRSSLHVGSSSDACRRPPPLHELPGEALRSFKPPSSAIRDTAGAGERQPKRAETSNKPMKIGARPVVHHFLVQENGERPV